MCCIVLAREIQKMYLQIIMFHYFVLHETRLEFFFVDHTRDVRRLY